MRLQRLKTPAISSKNISNENNQIHNDLTCELL